MTQKQYHLYWDLGLSLFLLVSSVPAPMKRVLAQPIADETLGTESSIVTNVDGVSTQINGGASRSTNLFHSFKQFNIGEKQTVFFSSPSGITNIITRVTGGSPSEILGSLGVLGNANLFLINPNGIIFGANASLNLQGSFIASTASSAIFADGTQFSAINPQASLLTVSIPIGLQYGTTNSSIQVQKATLEVQLGQTLGLIGGEVTIKSGNLFAPDGKIEVGSVATNSLVSLNSTLKGWSFGYENVSNFQNISITKDISSRIASQVDTSGDRGGDISLYGKQILLADSSQIASATDGAGTGGNIVVNASDFFLIKGLDSLLTTATTGSGSGGNITVNTGKLILEDRAAILTDSSGLVDSSENSSFATGSGGNLIVNASTSVELRNGSSLSSQSLDSGNAGNIKINTDSLVVDGINSGVSVSSLGTGDAGNLTIAARTISLDNGGQLTATSSSGNGGNINLQKLDSLVLRDQSKISTSAQGAGNGGNIDINTKLLVGLENSDITANAFDGEGGFIQINTKGVFGLEVREQLTENSEITAFSQRDPSLNGVIEIDRLENNPENALLTLPAEPVNISGLIAQGCSSGAGSVARRGSEFVVTGRGGLPPNPQEAIRSDVALADLGSPVQPETTQAKLVTPTNQNTSKLTELVEAQGWVIGSQGEVILTASAPNVTSSIPWMQSRSCHG